MCFYMIGKLKGIVDEINLDHIILDVSGVGYKVFVTSNNLSSLHTGQNLSLNIEMYVREEQISLYGFTSKPEQRWFNILQTVQGVGSRVALSILSSLSPERLIHAIISEDQRTIKSISGIGPKLAARIINELKDKPEVSSFQPVHLSTNVTQASGNAPSTIFNDALNALINLGFARSEVFKVLSELQLSNDNMSLEEVIKVALAKVTVSQ